MSARAHTHACMVVCAHAVCARYACVHPRFTLRSHIAPPSAWRRSRSCGSRAWCLCVTHELCALHARSVRHPNAGHGSASTLAVRPLALCVVCAGMRRTRNAVSRHSVGGACKQLPRATHASRMRGAHSVNTARVCAHTPRTRTARAQCVQPADIICAGGAAHTHGGVMAAPVHTSCAHRVPAVPSQSVSVVLVAQRACA